MTRTRLLVATTLTAALFALSPAASAQSGAPEDAPAAVEASVRAALGMPPGATPAPAAPVPAALVPPEGLPDRDVPAWFESQIARRRIGPPVVRPPGAVPVAAPIVPDDVPDADVPARFEEAIRARQRDAAAESEAAPVAPPAAPDESASFAPSAGRVHVRLGTASVRGTATARTSQNVVVDAGSVFAIAPTAGLGFTGGDDQTLDTDGALSLNRLTLAKSAGTVTALDNLTITGTLDLSDDVLIAGANLTVSGTVAGTGGYGVSGAATQLVTLPAPATLGRFEFRKTGGTATLSQPLTVSGTFTSAGTGTLVAPVTVATTGTLSLVSGTLTLGSDLTVFGTLTAGAGTFARNGFALRLAATTAGSTVSRLAAIAGDGSTVGDALVYDRPFLDGQGWRMIASPFAPIPFTALTDDFHTQGATGADTPAGAPNLIRWTPANAPGARYVGVTDFGQTFEPGRGYFLYAYGTQPGSGVPILPTTWDVVGTEPSGTVAVGLSFDLSDAERRFNLLGNPYAAPVDWHAVQAAGQLTASYAVWDPGANGGLGNYAFYSTTGVATGRAGRYVPAFQGFWAESSGSSPFVLTFDRAWKAPAETAVLAGRTAGVPPHLRLHLEGDGLEATDPVAVFMDDAAEGEDIYDATWLAPLSVDHATAYFVRAEDGRPLVFEARPARPSAPFRLAVGATRTGTYTLSWPDLALAPTGPLTLVDLETGTRVDLRAQASYAFSVRATAPQPTGTLPDALAAATAPRFELVVGERTTAGDDPGAVTETVLAAARPNPASGPTAFRFALAAPGPVRVAVYDLLGRAVATVVDETRPAGWHDVAFDASGLAAGVYVVRLTAAGGDGAGTALRTARLVVAH